MTGSLQYSWQLGRLLTFCVNGMPEYCSSLLWHVAGFSRSLDLRESTCVAWTLHTWLRRASTHLILIHSRSRFDTPPLQEASVDLRSTQPGLRSINTMLPISLASFFSRNFSLLLNCNMGHRMAAYKRSPISSTIASHSLRYGFRNNIGMSYCDGLNSGTATVISLCLGRSRS
ncbi:hypothetical protein OBBRIDRAFT_664323 [Obba rivulosa]|uniref:Uncharacterized protein n=1 Tax=Obba rivulosa TaxID=1052685 RepID=A0A8E2DL37_9APHY|nr:hypothetical protein OBBRIDRAFT_664323 [Obba rivulosa]